jgi:hypothetical protein
MKKLKLTYENYIFMYFLPSSKHDILQVFFSEFYFHIFSYVHILSFKQSQRAPLFSVSPYKKTIINNLQYI